jgi:uncharacterized protein involved in outer membrane biogenesis
MGIEFRPTVVPQVAVPVAASPAELTDRSGLAPSRGRWLKWASLLIILVVLLDVSASLIVRRDRVRRRLNARLEAAFGRPVDVDSYSFSLWGGPTLEANGIRVAENPRFGHEYFLRADSLSVRLRWLSLLRGRFELESLSLTAPILNVVTDEAANWNLAEWLGHPPAPAANSIGPVRIPFVPRFRSIRVDDGRIDFKRGDEKLPFAFIGVSGAIYADGPQRWRLDLEAAPWRAAALLQQAGTIHLAGSVGGTSSALRPANLQVSWTEASLPDFLRLVRGEDPGIRGTLGIALNAQTSGNGWAVEGQAELGQLHRWDFSVRPDSPSLSIAARMALDVPASTLDITEASIDTAHSNLHGSGKISWAQNGSVTKSTSGNAPVKAPSSKTAVNAARQLGFKSSTPVAFQINSVSIDLADALSWLRAFRSQVPNNLNITGFAQAHGNIYDWPARLTDLTVATNGALISGGGLEATVRVGQTLVNYDRGVFHMLPATLSLAGKDADAGSFRVEMISDTKHSVLAPANAGLHLVGGAANAADVLAIANAFGWDLARGWQIAGPLHCDLRWPELEWPWKARPVGTVSIGGTGDQGASLRAPFLNLPVSGLQFHMDWKPGARHIALAAAQAFGAHWTGTFDRSDAAQEWQFAVAADQLTTVDLDRWLNPRWRESFIDRMLPFLNSSVPATAVPDSLRGVGRLTLGNLSAVPFAVQNLSGDLTLNGRDITLDNAMGQFSGGTLSGTLTARLNAIPDYQLRANFMGIDVAALTTGSQPDAAPFTGTASGEAELSMQGTSRSGFADSLECKGSLTADGALWHNVSLVESMAAAKFIPGNSEFSQASGQFACANGAIALHDIVLTHGTTELRGSGTVDFARRLDLQMHVAPEGLAVVGPAQYTPGAETDSVRITGTVAAPEFSKVTPARRPR